jgi:hypothetical protein
VWATACKDLPPQTGYCTLFDSPHGEAGDEPIQEEAVQNCYGDTRYQGCRHQRAPAEDIAPDKLGGDPYADSFLGRDRNEGQSVNEFLHAEGKGENYNGQEP